MSKSKKPQRRDSDVHHLCFPRKKWSNGYAKAIRNYWYFMVLIPRRTLHANIHKELRSIPCPSGQSAAMAYDHIRLMDKYGALSLDDPIEKRLNLLIGVFDCIEQPTANALRRELEIIRKYEQKPS